MIQRFEKTVCLITVWLDISSIYTWFKNSKFFSFFSAEAALNCYTSADDMSIKEECGMQTGCIKKFYQKSKLWQEKLHEYLTSNRVCQKLMVFHTSVCPKCFSSNENVLPEKQDVTKSWMSISRNAKKIPLVQNLFYFGLP